MEADTDNSTERSDSVFTEQTDMNADISEMKEVRRRKKQFYKLLRQQMEFYFSDANLTKNRFMGKRVREDPNVDLNLFLQFNKIRALTGNTNDIVNALRKSKMLAVTEDGTKVYRTTPVEEKKNSDDCTIYVEQLPPDAEHEWLRSVFAPYGEVPYVSIPKYSVSHMNKGFAFVEFDTPDAAKRALEAFGAMGCCIPSQINPDQLISCSSNEDYRVDQLCMRDPMSEDIFQATYENKEEKVESEDLEPHRKNEEEAVELCCKNEVDDVEETPTNSDVSKEKLSRKRKLTDEDKETELDTKKNFKLDESECKEESEANMNDDVVCEENTNGEEKENEEDEIRKKKSRRHKKKSKKEERTAEPEMSLRILSKVEWKRLRNKYLSLQKSRMMILKQHLSRSRWGNNYTQEPREYYHYSSQRHEEPPKEPAKEKPAKQFNFIPGVIANVRVGEPITDVKAFKANARAHTDVLYVDVDEGSTEAYIRCGSAEAAKKLTTERQWQSVEVLSGEKEAAYWEKITRDREQKLGGVIDGKKKGRRGRDKLLKKAEKALGKHIRFDEHE